MDEERLLTPKEAAAFLRCSVNWLARDRTSGKPRIPFIKLGRLVRYSLRTLREVAHVD